MCGSRGGEFSGQRFLGGAQGVAIAIQGGESQAMLLLGSGELGSHRIDLGEEIVPVLGDIGQGSFHGGTGGGLRFPARGQFQMLGAQTDEFFGQAFHLATKLVPVGR